MQSIKLAVKKRDVFGRKAKKTLGDKELMGNVFGKGMDSVAIVGNYQAMEKAIREAGTNHVLELEIDGADNQLALVSEIERDTVTQRLHHVNFFVVHKGQKVSAEVPLKITGNIPAEATGKILITMLDSLEIESIPSKLPEILEVDGSGLEEEGDKLTVADVAVPEGVEILTDPENMIAKIEVPRAQIEEEEEDEVDAADVPSEHGDESAADESENSNES